MWFLYTAVKLERIFGCSFVVHFCTCNLAEWVEKVKLAGSAKTAMQAKWLPGCQQ